MTTVKTRTMTIRLPVETLEFLKRLAIEQDRSAGYFARRAVEAWVEREAAKLGTRKPAKKR